MKFFRLTPLSLSLATGVTCLNTTNGTTPPISFGYLILPGFDLMDVAGPLEALFTLSLQTPMTLSLISPNPLNTTPPTNWPSTLTSNTSSYFGISLLPTHTFATAPPLDVLLLHGGAATRAPNLSTTFDFIRARYPSLQYLLSVCTGAGLAARAGVLDGRRATTNKRAWAQTTALGPKTYWVSHARWVVDGNVWTGSGVSAGIDTVLAWIGTVFGNEVAGGIADFMEYERHVDASWDPFAVLYNLTDVGPVG